MNENIFTISKREQRAAIAIILALLIATVVAHYRSLHTDIRAPATQSSEARPQEEQVEADDSH